MKHRKHKEVVATDVTSIHDHVLFKKMLTHRTYALLLVAVTTALAFPGSTPPGHAATANGQPPQASSELELTVSEGLVPIAASQVRTLTCDPPGGNHPYPEAACFDIATAEGDLARLPGEPGKVCSGVYKPVTVTALGDWWGVPVRFQESYGNACKLRAGTGLVFGF
ncbi:subtilase-type protease inhibitor [Kibdelosporangium philippinense]|uniref:Subtilase-type protease inhibitor n=1 Tax=Kibdelosporangium philippinense TaxID=211113 RepID=A0ABS8Z9R0_9PSEU|nr:SSI family serine proteinase inhibitor [Kibdelosporangium philippinense]MCE7004613.1 subtilase-type protease inhibitor [Kibdelosporangium philippinense]